MNAFNFQPLRVRRLSEIVEDSIKDLILAGELEVGSKLPPEREISRQFGVSIVTVREALRGLEAFGIIEKRRGKDGGVFITQKQRDFARNALQNFLTSKRLSRGDLIEVRRIVEPACARIASTRATAKELKDIGDTVRYGENIIKHIEKGQQISERDFRAVEARNVEFHRLIGEVTHNAFLTLIMDYIGDFLHGFNKTKLAPDIMFSSAVLKDHRNIYKAIKNGDAEVAEQEMFKHLSTIDEYVIKNEREP
jgi:GntR family transcriptional repressor for pyruvate dehydrogenase complex